MLDSDHIPLQHFFILLEHVMRHGLKPKKGLLGPKKELWNVLESVEQFMPEAADITASVRDLPTVKTHLGRARAWLRLALMQKRLADYFRLLIDKREIILNEYYERDALMMCEEAVIIGGLLVGLNVIDCNLCVKEEDLDSQQGVIDFSLYLRESNHADAQPESGVETASMTAVLDQKNYIEELNRHLNATVTNLQQKVEQLQTTNALMKEDLAIGKNQILMLQEENTKLRHALEHHMRLKWEESQSEGSGDNQAESSFAHFQKQFHEEVHKRQELEKELELQQSLKTEVEMARKLLEKEVHEKQDDAMSLRRQLEEIKAVNLQLYNKLQECELSLKQKSDQVAALERKLSFAVNALTHLETKGHKPPGTLD